MGVVLRQGLKASTVSYIGALIGAFNFVLLFPKIFSPDQIGLVRVLLDISLLIATFAQLGIPSISDKFFVFFNNPARKHDGFLSFLFILPLIGISLSALILVCIKDFWISAYQAKSPLLIDYFYYFIPLSFFIVYAYALESYCRAYLRIVVPIFLREIFIRIFLSCSGLLFYFEFISLQHFMMSLVLGYALSFILLIFYVKHLKVLFLAKVVWRNNHQHFRQMAKYSMYSILVGGSALISNKIDVLILGAFKGLGQVGVYSIAFFIGSIIEIPRRAISQISSPLISAYWKNNDLNSIKELYSKTAINQAIVGALGILIIWINIDFIFDIIPNSEVYQAGKYVVLIIGFAKFIDMCTGVNSEIILNSPFFAMNFVFNIIISFATVLLNYILIPHLGLLGAAFSALAAIILFNLLKIIYIWHKVKIHPLSWKICYIILLMLVLLAINEATAFENSFLLAIIKSSVYAGSFLSIIFIANISNDFNSLVCRIWGLLKMKF